MEKSQFAPINHLKFKPNLNKLTKEDLEEAGVIIAYLDEVDDSVEEILSENPQKKLKESKKWMLLLILMFFVMTIMQLGIIHINQEKEINLPISEEIQIISEKVT